MQKTISNLCVFFKQEISFLANNAHVAVSLSQSHKNILQDFCHLCCEIIRYNQLVSSGQLWCFNYSAVFNLRRKTGRWIFIFQSKSSGLHLFDCMPCKRGQSFLVVLKRAMKGQKDEVSLTEGENFSPPIKGSKYRLHSSQRLCNKCLISFNARRPTSSRNDLHVLGPIFTPPE